MYARITITPEPYICEVEVESIKDANLIAEALSTDFYNKLRGDFTIYHDVVPVSKKDVSNQLSYCSDRVSTLDGKSN